MNPEHIVVRRAGPGDAAAIAGLHLASHRVAYLGLVPDDAIEQGGLAARAALWEAELRRGVTVFLAESGRGLVAFCSVEPAPDPDDDPARTGHIGSLHARPELRGQGLGTRLCEHALAWAKETGRRDITLWVLEENVAARRFYERLGFVADGGRKTYGGTRVPVVRYRLELPRAGRRSRGSRRTRRRR